MKHRVAAFLIVCFAFCSAYAQHKPFHCNTLPQQEKGDYRDTEIQYLRGVQYGWEDGLGALLTETRKHLPQGEPDVLNKEWTNALILPAGLSWSDLIDQIELACTKKPEALLLTVANGVVQTARNEMKAKDVSEIDRIAALASVRCRDVGSLRKSFYAGYGDGFAALSDSAIQVFGSIEDPASQKTAQIFKGLKSDQLEIAAASEDVSEFCRREHNADLLMVIAFMAVGYQKKGESTDSLLETFYCSHQDLGWLRGKHVNGSSCWDLAMFGQVAPVLNKPFGYMVGILNHSKNPVVVNWEHVGLSCSDGDHRPISPGRIAGKLDKSARISESLAYFAASMRSHTPQTARIYGPDGVTVISIDPPLSGPIVAAEEAERAGEPKRGMADLVRSSALLATTLRPGDTLIGIVFFEKPKSSECTLVLRVPGQFPVSIPVEK